MPRIAGELKRCKTKPQGLHAAYHRPTDFFFCENEIQEDKFNKKKFENLPLGCLPISALFYVLSSTHSCSVFPQVAGVRISRIFSLCHEAIVAPIDWHSCLSLLVLSPFLSVLLLFLLNCSPKTFLCGLFFLHKIR